MDCTAKVLQALITGPDGIKGFIGGRKEKVETIVKDSMTLNFIKNVIDFGFGSEEKVTYSELMEDEVIEIFRNLIKDISIQLSNEYTGLIIIIDEFDRVKDTSGMASLIKAIGSGNVKFMISGISRAFSDLIDDHESLIRHSSFGKINLDPMKDQEIEDIFNLISIKTKEMLTFDKLFLEEVKNLSGGYPFNAHFFGQIALDAHVQHYPIDKPAKLSKEILYRGCEYFVSSEVEMEDMYYRLIGSDPYREMVLKSFAIQSANRVLESHAAKYCMARGVPQPKKSLTTILNLARSQIKRHQKHYILFQNPIFKIFCKIKEPILIKKEGTNYIL